MTLLILEALLALLIFVGIVWWTMFSGRSKGELHSASELPSEKQDNNENSDTKDKKKSEKS